jgi:hypothetical protein
MVKFNRSERDKGIHLSLIIQRPIKTVYMIISLENTLWTLFASTHVLKSQLPVVSSYFAPIIPT